MSHRPQMLAKAIRKIVATSALEIPPEVANVVSITDVTVSEDLGAATIYVTAMEHVSAAVSWFRAHASEFRKIIADELKIFRVPALTFKVDERIEKINRLEKLLEDK